MRRNWIFWAMLLAFIIEGALMPWIIPNLSETQVKVAPHFVLILILFAAVYMNRLYGLAFGLLFGLLHDVAYHGEMLGIYTFCMGFTGYAAGLVFRSSRMNMALMMLAAATGSLLFDSMVYGFYRLFRVSQVNYDWAFMHTILPSLLVNLMFALMIYIPARHMIQGKKSLREEEGEE